MRVYASRDILYRGRQYRFGENIDATPEQAELWLNNGAASIENPNAPDCQMTERATAPGPPGIVEGGNGGEGEMPGRDNPRKRTKR